MEKTGKYEYVCFLNDHFDTIISDSENSEYEMDEINSESTRLFKDKQYKASTNDGIGCSTFSSSNQYDENNSCFAKADEENNDAHINTNSDKLCDPPSKQPAVHENTQYDISDMHTDDKVTFYVVLMALFSAIGGFLFGYDTGVISGAMLLIRDEFSLSSFQQELVISVTIAAAFVSALAGGFLSDRFGRKVCTLLASFVFTCGAVILGLADSVVILIVGRLTLGIGIGIASMTVTVYIAEVAPSHLRGRLVTLNAMFITGGQFVASLVDGGFSYLDHDGWRYMLGFAGIPSLIQLIGFIFLPESPRYLVKCGQIDKARQVLCKVRGIKNVERELKDISDQCLFSRNASNCSRRPTLCLIIQSGKTRRALIIGCGLQLFQQLSGINTVMYYSASIIKMSGVHSQHTAIWLASMAAGVNFLFTLLGVWLVERIGRRPLLLSSLAGVILSLSVLAVGFQLVSFNSPAVTFNQTLDRSHCSEYRSCDSCVSDGGCGFCYQNAGRSIVNSSCLAVADDDFGYSKVGRCSRDASTSPHSVTWGTDYCITPYSWISVFGLVLYLMCFAPGMGSMPWTINAEMYPLWARSTGNSLSASVNWLSNLVVSMTFLTLIETITKYGTYWLFAGLSVVGFLFFFCFLPETKGRKLEDVEELFSEPWSPCCSARNTMSDYSD